MSALFELGTERGYRKGSAESESARTRDRRYQTDMPLLRWLVEQTLGILTMQNLFISIFLYLLWRFVRAYESRRR